MKTRHASPRLAVVLMTLLGLAAFAKAPAPRARVVSAYSEYTCFVMSEVSRGAITPEEHQQCEKDVSKALVDIYPKLSTAERKRIDQTPAEWAHIQAEWARLDEAAREQVRVGWAQKLQAEMQGAGTATGGSEPQQR